MVEDKYLDELFIDIVDQSTATSLLRAAIKKDHIAPAYLFIGPKGVGRKKAALRFLEGLIIKDSEKTDVRNRLENSNHPDLLTIEPTYLLQGRLVNKSEESSLPEKNHNRSQIRIEQIKNVTRFLTHQSVESTIGMVIIQEIERVNEAAANALLKTLEEPINGVVILISERPEKLLNTIRSRCQIIPFNRLPNDVIEEQIRLIQTENENRISDKTELQALVNLSNGSPTKLKESMQVIQEIPQQIWVDLKNLKHDPIQALSLAKEITDELSREHQLILIDWMQNNIWVKEHNPNKVKRLEKLRGQLQSFIQPRIAWEVAFLELF